jgi:excinuclease ABC subunit C
VKEAIAILEGRSAATVKRLEALMERASQGLLFEEAAAWRDRLEVLNEFHAGHSLVSFRGENRDVIAFCRQEQQAAVCVLLVRSGRITETKTFNLFDLEISDEEILEGVLQQFYETPHGKDVMGDMFVQVYGKWVDVPLVKGNT